MKIGIAGLGLIGGSMAKAYKSYATDTHTNIEIYALDTNEETLSSAKQSSTIDGELDAVHLSECDVIFLGLYPEACIKYLCDNAKFIRKGAIVMDLCGTKRNVCTVGYDIAKNYGFTFVGGHPMAGTHNSGYKYSRSNMFKSASMVIVPENVNDTETVQKVKDILSPVGFGHFSIISAEHHDKIIAFTSQLAHVVSNAYVKSPTAKSHKGFSAGSYKDLTRVAWLNETMWTELFMENSDNLLFEIESIIGSLTEYRDALRDGDREKMFELLKEGRIAKEEIDG